MARATRVKDDPTPEYQGLADETDAEQYVQDLHAADPADQQVDTVDGELIEPTPEQRAAMARAADYVRGKGLGDGAATLIAHIAGSAVDTQELNVVIIEQMANRILNASSAAEVLDPFGTVHGRDLLNKPLWITGCQFLESTVDGDGFPWYVTFEVQDRATGQSVPVTVGGEKLVYKAAGIDLHGGWPIAAMITQEPSKRDPSRRINDLVPTANI